MKPTIYTSNKPQGVAIRGRAAYSWLRSHIRMVRRNCGSRHMDVLYYEESLGLGPIDQAVTRRHYAWDRVHAIGITGPVGILP